MAGRPAIHHPAIADPAAARSAPASQAAAHPLTTLRSIPAQVARLFRGCHGRDMQRPWSNSGTGGRGGSIVELLVVTAVLSVIAALVVPRYTSASEQAREEELLRELQILRGQLEHYRQVEGCDPASVIAGVDWRDLLDARYLVRTPQNPMHPSLETLDAGPTLDPGTPVDPDVAWYFDVDRRTIHAVAADGFLLEW